MHKHSNWTNQWGLIMTHCRLVTNGMEGIDANNQARADGGAGI
jgi:hypothetical protein